MLLYEPGTTDLSPYFRLAKCPVLPLGDLYHPVLPYCPQAKLTFPLCRTCVEDQLDHLLLARSVACPHTDEQRALTVTWCTSELEEAVRPGYRILHVHEIWHFQQSCTGALPDVKGHVIVIKRRSREWPEGCETPEQQQAHIITYYAHKGICVDSERIGKNPRLRALVKLMLNSIWGKFGERSNRSSLEDGAAGKHT